MNAIARSRFRRSYNMLTAKNQVFDPDAHTTEARQTWSEAAPRYEQLADQFFAPISAELVAFAGIRKGWSVLDVACGPGLASRAAARKVRESGAVMAADLAPGMVALAQARPVEKGAAPIAWREMNAEKLDLPDSSFDAVLCQLGLMLFARPHEALSEMRRVAKPGAPVTCLVQGRRSAMLFTSLLMDAMVSRAPHLRAPEGAPTLFSFGPEGVLDQAFARAGLSDIVIKRLSGAFPFASAAEYWETLTRGAGKTGAMLRSLPADAQAKIKADVLRRAARHRSGKGVAIPYEFAMARGIKWAGDQHR